jgi:hypothetical protein
VMMLLETVFDGDFIVRAFDMTVMLLLESMLGW